MTTNININITINFDMDGTLADFYGVENWLDFLEEENVTPYAVAAPTIRFNTLARKLNALQKEGYKLAIISWLSKTGSDEYNKEVAAVKKEWLKKHLPSVNWDRITIVPYGTPKETWCDTVNDILFDDEKKNRDNWTGKAYDVFNIMEELKKL